MSEQGISLDKMKQSNVILQNKLFGKIKSHQRMFTNTYLGIDIGISDVRYVYLYRLKDQFEIISYGIEKLPEMDVEREKAIKLALKNLFTKRKIKATQVVLSVYGPEISTRILDMPDMPEKSLFSAIELQNKNEIAYFDENTVWDYDILKKEDIGGKKILKIMVIVAHNQAMIQYVESLQHLGIKPSLIIPKPKAHEASYKKFIPHYGKDLLVDIGYESTMFCFFRKGQLWYVRNIAMGGSNLHKGLEKEIAKNEKTVQKKLENMGKPPILNEKIKEKILNLSIKSNPILDVFSGEVRKTVEYIKNEFSIPELDNVYLCGNGSLNEGLKENIKNIIGKSYELIYPIFKPAYKVSDYIDFVSPFGSALYLSDKFNLIPKKYKESWRFNYLKKWAYFAGFIIIIVLGLFSMQQYNNYNKQEHLFKIEKDKFEKLNPKILENEAALSNLKIAWEDHKKLILTTERDYFPIAALKIIADVLPEGIVIYEYIYEKNDQVDFSDETPRQIIIKGETYKNVHLWDKNLPTLIERLRGSNIFDKVTLVHQEISPEENKGVFSIELSINGDENEKKNIK